MVFSNMGASAASVVRDMNSLAPPPAAFPYLKFLKIG